MARWLQATCCDACARPCSSAGPEPTPVPDLTPVPAPTPAPAVLVVELGGEVFIQNDHIAVGVNASGTLSTYKVAPAGFVTVKEVGYLRLGLLRIGDGKALSDEMLKGMPVVGWVVTYDSVSVRNMGVIETDMPGKLKAVPNDANVHGEKGRSLSTRLLRSNRAKPPRCSWWRSSTSAPGRLKTCAICS